MRREILYAFAVAPLLLLTAVKRNVLVYVTSQRRPVAVDITGEAIGTK